MTKTSRQTTTITLKEGRGKEEPFVMLSLSSSSWEKDENFYAVLHSVDNIHIMVKMHGVSVTNTHVTILLSLAYHSIIDYMHKGTVR